MSPGGFVKHPTTYSSRGRPIPHCVYMFPPRMGLVKFLFGKVGLQLGVNTKAV